MDQGLSAIRQQLMANNESFRQLAARHSQLESQLHSFKERRFLSAEEEVEEVRLKKLKLHIKDEMEQMLRQELGHVTAVS